MGRVSRERLIELFDYNHNSRVLRWQKGGKGRRKDRVAGTVGPDGQLRVDVDGESQLVERVIFTLLNG